MRKLMKFELYKLKKQNNFYICSIIMIALLFLSSLTTNIFANANPDYAVQTHNSGIDSMISALGSCSFLLIAGIFTALTVCEDYEQQTIKNIFSRGYSRKRFYSAKVLIVWLATSIMFLLAQAAAFTFGSLYFGIGEADHYRFLAIIGVQYVVAMANIAFYIAISSILRKTGASIAAIIVAPIVVNVVLTLGDSILKLKEVSLTNYWLSSFLGTLTQSVSSDRLLVCLAASLAYILLFLLGGMMLNQKLER